MQQENSTWYKEEWFIVLSLLFVFPLGLFLMWKFNKWTSTARITITTLIIIIALSSITYFGKLQVLTSESPSTETVTVNETKDENKEEDTTKDKDDKNFEKSNKETSGKYQEWFDTVTKGTEDTNTNNDTDSNATRLQKAALEKAKVYSEDLHMSKQGIYDILTSENGEKFHAEDAQFAIDHLDADYEKNALEKAKSYAENMNMSNDAIYDILVSSAGEKFTDSEARYAIDNLDN